MNIRAKTLILIGLVLLVSTVMLHRIVYWQQMQSYLEIERKSAEKDLNRVQQLLVSDLTDYAITASDWGSWTDTYNFADDRDPEYISANLEPNTLLDMGVNFILLLTEDGDIIHQVGVNLKSERTTTVSDSLLAQLQPDSPLILQRGVDEDAFGLLSDDRKVLLTGVAPILRSDDSGPSRGTFIIGRYLDGSKGKLLESRAQLDITFVRRGPDGFPERLKSQIEILENNSVDSDGTLEKPWRYLDYIDEDTIQGLVMFPEMNAAPVLLASVTIPRTVYQAGKESLNVLLFAMLVGGFILFLTVFFLLEAIVLRRLSVLERQVSSIGKTQDLSVRVNEQGNDELSKLGGAVNWMLTEIEASSEKLAREYARAEGLLLNILPKPVAEQLKSNSNSIAEGFDEVTILFADIVGFTDMAAKLDAPEVVRMLNRLFSRFDDLATELGLEKIKTIGDAYMAAAGLPIPSDDHAQDIADMALSMIDATEEVSKEIGHDLRLRIGINTGVVVAGVIGKSKFIYDLWGDAVNIASRMESSGETGRIQVTQSSYDLLKDSYILVERGMVEIKGRGPLKTYFLVEKIL